MREIFHSIADYTVSLLKGGEVILVTFDGEESDFVRFNHNAVRQAGAVTQCDLGLDLIRGQRHAAAQLALTGTAETDRQRVQALVGELRDRLDIVPEDPHLLYATEVRSTEKIGRNELAPAHDALGAILAGGRGKDAVGLYAQGPIYRGFANSLGQRNWFSTHTFNLEWCFYLRADKAVKSDYAGFRWDPQALAAKMDAAARQLALLEREPKTIERGQYRVYLTPTAVREIVSMLSWNGFGLKAHRAKIAPLIHMTEEGKTLNSAVTISEHTAAGISPNFERMGFVRPDKVELISAGRFKDHLVSARSAKEFGVAANGAESHEFPYSMEMEGGAIPQSEALQRLGTGVYVGNLWYLNYSDRPACRMTGMTRFATFWVENGQIVAPLNVMRFDESAYRMLGPNLLGLTSEREMILASETYGGREVASHRLPGALIEGFAFTL